MRKLGIVGALGVSLAIVGVTLVPAREARADTSSPRASSPRASSRKTAAKRGSLHPAETPATEARAAVESRTEPHEAVDSPRRPSDQPELGDRPVERDVALATPEATETTRSAQVAVDGITFENGEVPRAATALEKMKKELTRCAVTDDPRDDGKERLIRLRFLVRAPGRAEGVDVVQVRDMSPDMARCVALTMKNRFVGHPSDDPVSVELTFRLSQKLENQPTQTAAPRQRDSKGQRQRHASRARVREGDSAGLEARARARAREAKETEEHDRN